jgi:hypothetical protein
MKKQFCGTEIAEKLRQVNVLSAQNHTGSIPAYLIKSHLCKVLVD